MIFALVFGLIAKAQNKELNIKGNLKCIYSNPDRNGPGYVHFEGNYRIYNHGSLRIGYNLKVANISESYYYKGKTYYSSDIPEIKETKITSVKGILTVSNNSTGKIKKNVEIFIGGYLDQNGSLGGNNTDLLDNIPDNFSINSTYASFEPQQIFYDGTAVNSAIEAFIANQQKDKEKKEIQRKYEDLITEANTSFTLGDYETALLKYSEASTLDVSDKSSAANGVTRSREKLGNKLDGKDEKQEKNQQKSVVEKSSIDDWKATACATEQFKLERLVKVARNNGTYENWQKAQQQELNMQQLCGFASAYSQEIQQNMQSATLVKSAETAYALVTKTPWSYGYGQFFNAPNQTYVHRFIIGGLDVAYDDRVVKLSFSAAMTVMRLPMFNVNYRFEGNKGEKMNSIKTVEIDNYSNFAIAVGTSLNIWPQKNVFIKLNPEIQAGLSSKYTGFTLFPTVNGSVGVRLGKVYLSGTYGLLWSKINANNFDGEDGSVTYGGTTTIIKGRWIPDNVNDGKWLQNSYWLVSIGLQLGN